MKYTPELVSELIKYIEAGNYQKTACEAVGLGETTFYEWMKEKPEFAESIKKAKSKAIARNVMIIQKAAQTSWQAAAWFLERKDYERWGRKELVGGIADKPIKAEFVVVDSKNATDKSN